jgi:hypothetical protein
MFKENMFHFRRIRNGVSPGERDVLCFRKIMFKENMFISGKYEMKIPG